MIAMGESDEDNLPFAVRSNQGTSDFLHGRTSGYIATIALSSPYRAEEDEEAKALGYAIGPWPIVPLSGSVVKEYAGLLEAYQTHLAFRSPGGAHEFLAGVVDSNDPVTSPDEATTPRIGDETFVFPTTGNAQAGVESEVGIDFRFNSTVVQLDLRGGTEMTFAYALQVATAAAGLLETACGSQL